MNLFLPRLALAAVSLVSFSLTVWAQTGIDPRFSSTSLAAYPPNIAEGTGGPMMMLTASRDHTLFAPIYTDYEDIDGDGSVDYTFKPTFRYYGYFDNKKCYAYDTSHAAGSRFEPKVASTVTGGRETCPSDQALWSGNFLNWATMTRLDVVRKTLYGGRRVEDTLTDTTLEMAALAHDAHAFVKYYGGSDIRDYTPFTHAELGRAGLTMCSRGTDANGQGAPQLRVAKGNYSLWATTPGTVCNWSEDQPGFAFGQKAQAFYKEYGPPTSENPDAEQQAHRPNLPSRGSDGAKYGGVGPELAIRVQACVAPDVLAFGSERCRTYRRTVGGNLQVSHKPIGLLQEFGSSEQTQQPVRAEFGLITGSYDDNFRGGQLRKNVGSVNDEVDLGTGRFCHLLSATDSASNCRVTAATFTSTQGATVPGIIRSFDRLRLYQAGDYNSGAPRNAGGDVIDFPLPHEVPNGNFPSWGNPMSEMITQALAYFANLPMGGAVSTAGGRDAAVGLPVSVTAADPLNDAVNDAVAGVSRRDLYGRAICRPMHMLAISSGAVTHDTDETGSSEDVYDTAAGFIRKNVAPANQAQATIQAATDRIGQLEGVNNTSRSVGSASADFGVDCTSKQVGTVVSAGLAQVAGVCPEAPAVKGTYLGAGAAFIANTRAVRDPADLSSANGGTVAANRLPASALRVRSYAATLSGGVARIEVPIPGKSSVVYITPESSWDFANFNGKVTNGVLMPGAMLTFRSIYGNATSASYVVTWNDAQFGGDYDMDIVGFLRWEIKPSTTKQGAYELTVMTDILNHDASARGSHGFSIIGTDRDRRYLTHGGEDFAVGGTDSDCNNLTVNSQAFNLQCAYTDRGMKTSGGGGSDDFAWPSQYNGMRVDFFGKAGALTTTVAKTFTITDGATDVSLRDPLWYVAKYGSFNTGETAFGLSTSAVPDARVGSTPNNWDSQNNGGSACSASGCADGEPDGYFLARRPELLEERLRSLLLKITQGSNSAPAVSTVQLLSDSLKYTAEFFQDGFGGTVKAYSMDPKSQLFSVLAWDASDLMTALGNDRTVITDNGQSGLLFTWSSLNVAEQEPYRAAMLGLTLDPTPTAAQREALTAQAGRAEKLIAYMRGDSDNADQGSLFRVRSQGVMGPIVNSTPWLQSGKVAARYADSDFPNEPSYRAFVNSTKASALAALWFGANDGQLHGLNALTGQPLLSYVPSPLVGRLESALSAANSGPVALMDGSPFTGDVLVKPGTGFKTEATTASTQSTWRTYLFSSLGRGGRAVFALDVTSPAALREAAQAASAFKWVFSARDDSDMGYQLLDPVRHAGSGEPSAIVHLNSGDFGLLVPNGYGSSGGKAALFVLAINGPDATGWRPSSATSAGSYRKIMVSGATDSLNGLMGATWVDLDNNGTADVVYATDLRGQLWKFDLRSSDPREWQSALVSGSVDASGAVTTTEVPVPLFTARSGDQALSITTSPVTFFPNYGGTMISFGTGRAIESVDFPDSSVTQRFFTVWDKGRYPGDRINPPLTNQAGAVTVANALPQVNGTKDIVQGTSTRTVKTFVRRVLRRDADGNVYQVQTDDQGEVVLQNGQEVVLAEGTTTQEFNPAEHDGWYLDFPSAGEAVLSSPIRRLNYILFTTVRPKSGTEREISCSMDPQGALYAFSPVSGLPIRALLSTTSLLMGVDIGDQKVIVVGDASGGSSVNTGGDNPSRSLGNETNKKLNTSASNLRLQWREIMGMRTHRAKSAEEEETPAAGGEDK